MPAVQTPPRATDEQPATGDAARRWWQVAWSAITGLVGGVVGLAPHVLHHVGLLAGTALVAGSGGTALFGLVGLVASVPLLRRLHRRFGNWRVPALALWVSTVLFLLSAFVIGPAISGETGNPGPDRPYIGHLGHH
jgi:hypothetical protein